MYRPHQPTRLAPRPAVTQHSHAHDHCCGGEPVAAQVELAPVSEGSRLSRFRIEAMDCPTEQTLIQNKLARMAGIEHLEFNLINRVLGVRHVLADTVAIEQAIATLGMTAQNLDSDAPAPVAASKPRSWLWLAGLTAAAAELVHFALCNGQRDKRSRRRAEQVFVRA